MILENLEMNKEILIKKIQALFLMIEYFKIIWPYKQTSLGFCIKISNTVDGTIILTHYNDPIV